MADLYQGGTPQLRRSSPRQTERLIPGLSTDRTVVKHRQFLDKVYGHISDPFKQWSLKRDSLKRMVEKVKPDYDKSDLDLFIISLGYLMRLLPVILLGSRGYGVVPVVLWI